MRTPYISRFFRIPIGKVRAGAAILAVWIFFSCAERAYADEGGVSFWLPGQYGSLAATPLQPGWSLATIYYHTSVSASGALAAQREVTIGRFSRNLNVDLNVRLDAKGDLVFVNPTYVFAQPVFGGQLAVGMAAAFGRMETSLQGTLTATLGGLTATRSGDIFDSREAFSDLYPTASLRWNSGVHNFMTYVSGDIPVGAYDSTRLANIGIGHGAVDGGVGYTYFNPATGHELSVVSGLTYNMKNNATDYQNGVDWHLDWGISQFLSKQMHFGLVGYAYQQLTADSGAPAFLGDGRSRVFAVGPQIGFLFPVGDMQGYVNIKGYKEFDARNRAEGWNAFVAFVISPREKAK
ncbi:MAG: transporter [Pseudorhodoplanes sp.]